MSLRALKIRDLQTDLPGGQPLSLPEFLGSLTPSGDSQEVPLNRRQIWRVAGRESGSPDLLESPWTSPGLPRTSPEVPRRLPLCGV